MKHQQHETPATCFASNDWANYGDKSITDTLTFCHGGAEGRKPITTSLMCPAMCEVTDLGDDCVTQHKDNKVIHKPYTEQAS